MYSVNSSIKYDKIVLAFTNDKIPKCKGYGKVYCNSSSSSDDMISIMNKLNGCSIGGRAVIAKLPKGIHVSFILCEP